MPLSATPNPSRAPTLFNSSPSPSPSPSPLRLLSVSSPLSGHHHPAPIGSASSSSPVQLPPTSQPASQPASRSPPHPPTQRPSSPRLPAPSLALPAALKHPPALPSCPSLPASATSREQTMDSRPLPAQKPAHPLAVSSLLSPPEMMRSDSFSNLPNASHVAEPPLRPTSEPFADSITHTTVHALPSNVRASAQGLPPSPPVSPYQQLHKDDSQGPVVEDAIRDPPLFPPSTTGNRIDATAPLFPRSSSTPEHDSIISQHIAATAPRNPLALPSRSDYELAISFRSCVLDLYSRNPREYLRNERATWHAYGRGAGNKQRSKPLKQLAPAPAGLRKTKCATAKLPRAPRATTKRTPKAAVLDSFEIIKPAATPKAPRVVTARDDVDFRSIPDYSPSLSTLPEDGRKIMKTDWKGPPLDLSTDPDRDLLHPSELIMAGVLRLSCATYIANKRRIFAARVKALQKGEDFNKTKAQQACKIDVNKASKLWSAYDRIGWFKPHHFQKYLGSVIEFDQ